MIETLKEVREALNSALNESDTQLVEYAITKLDALIEQVEKAEPVAWQWMGTGHFRKNLPKDAEKYCWRPLYATPQPAPSTSPVTDEQIEAAINVWFEVGETLHTDYKTRMRAAVNAAIKEGGA